MKRSELGLAGNRADQIRRLLEELVIEHDGWKTLAEIRFNKCVDLKAECDALAAENRRMLDGHKGDPCIFCGKMHDEVEVGPCPGPARLKADLEAKTARVEELRKQSRFWLKNSTRMECLAAENARLRAALEQVEFVAGWCPWCACFRYHRFDCARKLALTPPFERKER